MILKILKNRGAVGLTALRTNKAKRDIHSIRVTEDCEALEQRMWLICPDIGIEAWWDVRWNVWLACPHGEFWRKSSGPIGFREALLLAIEVATAAH